MESPVTRAFFSPAAIPIFPLLRPVENNHSGPGTCNLSATKLLQKDEPHYEKQLSFVQSIMGATDRRRDGWTGAGAMPGMIEVVLMLEGSGRLVKRR